MQAPNADAPGVTLSAAPTRALAEYAARLRFDDLPDAVVDKMKLSVLDTVGVALFGSTLPWGRIVGAMVEQLGGTPEATVWGAGTRTSSASAALANGTFAHGFELDESHLGAFFHPGSVALPAALGVAESLGDVSGQRLLAALVAGYEVGIRVGKALGFGSSWRGFHQQGIVGGICAAAAAGNLLKLDDEQMAHALGTAASQGGGLLSAQFGSMVKRFHSGKAAQAGVYSALLTHAGFTGIPDVFEVETASFPVVMSETPRPELLTDGLGEVFETLKVGYKPYACVGAAHASIWAVGELMRENGLTPDRIVSVTVRGNRHLYQHSYWVYEPNGVTAAQINLPYLLTVMIHEGDVFVDQFTEEKINSPKYTEYSHRVVAVIDPILQDNPPARQNHVIVELTLSGGSVVSKEVLARKGSPDNPLTTAELEHKFERLAGRVLNAARVEQLKVAIQQFESLDSVSALAELLVGA